MRIVTFDIETMGDLNGGFDIHKQEITVVGVHDSETDEYTSYTRDELNKLWPLLERADALVGYNSDHFDIPILNKYYPGNLTAIRSIDLLKEVKAVLGRRLRLDNLAEATLGKKKSGHGLLAQEWWEKGEVEKVRAYCLDDVRITRALYDYARTNGSLKYKDFDGKREIKLNTSHWESSEAEAAALTHTLPF